MTASKPMLESEVYAPHIHLGGKYAKKIGSPEIGSRINLVVSGVVDSIRQERKGHKEYGIEISAARQAAKNLMKKGGG